MFLLILFVDVFDQSLTAQITTMPAFVPQILIPTKMVLDIAKKLLNYDWLATYTKDMTTDIALNHTAIQMMQVIVGLNKSLKSIAGMKNVGEDIAACVKPLLIGFDDLPGDEAITVLFHITPEEIKCFKREGEDVLNGLDDVIQSRNKIRKKSHSDNFETTFYIMYVAVTYRPKQKLYNLFYGYSYQRDTSIWQWTLNGASKQKRLLAMEVAVTHRLGHELKQKAGNELELKEDDMEMYHGLLG